MKLFNYAKEVILQLQDAGYEAYFVGGAVRDHILKRQIKDFDITTNATHHQINRIFNSVKAIGANHGTLLVIKNHYAIEVSTFQGESLVDDLSKRDFTINAMAMSIDNVLIDPFGGREDLANNNLQTVRDAKEVFAADPLRLLRAVRFKVEYRMTLSPSTLKGLDACSSSIHKVSVERIVKELEKLCHCEIQKSDWEWLFQCFVINELYFLFEDKRLQRNLLSMSSLVKHVNSLSWWLIAIYHEDIREVRKGISYYRLPTKLGKDIYFVHQFVSENLQSNWTNEQLYKLGENRLIAALHLVTFLTGNKIDPDDRIEMYHQLPIKSKVELAISGKELLVIRPHLEGNKIGEMMDAIERAVINREISNDKEQIYHWLEMR